jgi:copper chaperone
MMARLIMAPSNAKEPSMITFQVPDMTCGHCAGTISRAIAGVDQAARLRVEIPRRLVSVASTASAAELAQAIRAAGYSPREVDERQQAAAVGGSCCCG